MMGTTSWLMRTAATFAYLERSIKAAPVQPGILYPPPRQNTGGWLTFPGWDVLDQQAQNEGQKDLARVKTAVTSPWVFADVQAIANEFASSTLMVMERKGDKLEEVENHPLELIWESPNEHMGRSFVSAFWAWSYVLSSRAYLYWVPDTGGGMQDGEVWPIPPWMIRPIPDPDDFISGYAFKSNSGAKTIVIPSEYITYSHSVNLFDVRDGLSFLAAADTDLRADLAASVWNLNFFDDNNGVPDGFLGVDPNTSDTDLQTVRMEVRDFFGGTKRGIAVGRTGDLKYTEFGRSQKDMEFGAGREFASKIVGRTLGFPDGYWSDLANRANAEQARRTMISGAVWPLLVRLSEDMNAKNRGVVQRYYGPQFRAQFKDIRPEDRQLKMEEMKMRMSYWPVGRLLEADDQEPLGDIRDLMLIAEITKGAPIPGSEAAQELEKQQQEKDEAQAQLIAKQVADGTIPDPTQPPPQLTDSQMPPAEQPAEEGAIKAQSDEERAMFAKMGGGLGKGKGYDKSKSKLTADKEKAKGGGSSGSSESAHESHPKGTESESPHAKLEYQPHHDKTRETKQGLQDMPHSELQDYGQSLMKAYAKGGDQMVHGLVMKRSAIVAELQSVGAELKDRATRQASRTKSVDVDDLDLWERKALKSVRRGGKAAVGFVSDAIPADDHARITAALKAATTIPEVKAAFKGDRIDALIAANVDGAIAWIKEAQEET